MIYDEVVTKLGSPTQYPLMSSLLTEDEIVKAEIKAKRLTTRVWNRINRDLVHRKEEHAVIKEPTAMEKEE